MVKAYVKLSDKILITE